MNKLISNFSSSTVTGAAPLTVDFYDHSSGNPTRWIWRFGDGSTVVNKKNPSHIYTKPGIYTVSLSVSNSYGSDTCVLTDYITVISLTPQFHAVELTSSVNSPVSFVDDSTGDITTWYWNFGDGNHSTVENPTHRFGAAGKYSVTLTISRGSVIVSITKPDYITIR